MPEKDIDEKTQMIIARSYDQAGELVGYKADAVTGIMEFIRRLYTGTTVPLKLIIPRIYFGAFGILVTPSMFSMAFTALISIPYSSFPNLKTTYSAATAHTSEFCLLWLY
jgi:hypothetical protein